AQIAPVHVGCLAENEADIAHETMLAKIATTWCMPPRTRSLPVAGVKSLLRREPVSLSAFRSARLKNWVEQTLQQRNIRAIYVFSGQMGQFVPDGWKGRLVVDLVDVDSAKFEAYGAAGKGPRGWIDRREGRMMRDVEAALVKRADITVLVSDAEAALLRNRVPTGGSITALRNGIDCAVFDPDAVVPEPCLALAGPHFVFTGQMDYAPNIEAVRRMARQIMPRLREAIGNAQFHIVGRAPTRDVLNLEGVHGTRVVGEVADTRPWLAGANAIVAPLTIARGVQNKVLEAMAMARPVVVSPQAATGIDAQPGHHFLIAQDDAAFTRELMHVCENAEHGRRIGDAARSFVLDNMSWPAMLAQLPRLLGMSAEAKADAA
ncbi:MAG: TIGR03087 family PEP-CTERM/XrtA system glycosyltransferase, partial [Alteraurantiacibacter sp.]